MLPSANPCDKCNLDITQGGCKCDNNCDCIVYSGALRCALPNCATHLFSLWPLGPHLLKFRDLTGKPSHVANVEEARGAIRMRDCAESAEGLLKVC